MKVVALLDTGAAWSILGGDIAEVLSEQVGPAVEPITLDTRRGKMTGHLHRMMVSLLAEPGKGNDLQVDSTVMVAPDWDGPPVLGFRGFLERLRFALDPGTHPRSEVIYFGPVA